MNYENLFLNTIFGGCVFLIITLCSLIFIGPIYEKNHYTKLTGIEVSYFDAFFTKLDPSKHIIIVDEK